MGLFIYSTFQKRLRDFCSVKIAYLFVYKQISCVNYLTYKNVWIFFFVRGQNCNIRKIAMLKNMTFYLSSPCFSSRSLCCWWWWNEAIEAPCAKNGKLFSANPKADCRLAFNASLYIEGLGAKEGLLALKSRILLVSHWEILEFNTWMERKDMRDMRIKKACR